MSNRNIFYGASVEETAFYEFAFHFVKERIHLNISDSGVRTSFSVKLDNASEHRIHGDPKVKAIMDPNDYSESHRFVTNNKNIDIICYPSCRDKNNRDCYAVFDINFLDKKPLSNRNISVNWDSNNKLLTCMELKINISYLVAIKKKTKSKKIKVRAKKQNVKKRRPS